MVEIRYSDNYEVANLTGQSVAFAREQFKGEFGIPEKAAAKLNGKKVQGKLETETCLCDADELTFATTAKGKGAILVGAMLLTMAITGSVFAYGWINDTTTINNTDAAADEAAVRAHRVRGE